MGANLVYFLIAVSIGLSAFATSVVAQTIPELLAEADRSLGRSAEIETGPPPSVELILAETDTIVRGIVGQPHSYLSPDQNEVLSDYPVLNPIVLWPRTNAATPMPTPPRPAPHVVITHIGGTVSAHGHSFTMHHKELPPLPPDVEGIFLLKQVGAHYKIAGAFYGAFKTDGDRLVPLTTSQEFANELREMTQAEAIQWLVGKKQQASTGR